jgi:chaperonin cofactor prefoldin
MLFDIRGRRKHVVRVVYAILALLMGASLFLVVGPVNIGSLLGNNSSTSAAKVLDEQAERTEQRLGREPNNEDLLISLARTRIAAGNAQTETNPETGATFLTPEGAREMSLATAAWQRYLKQAKSPSPSAALLVARAYFSLAEASTGLEEIAGSIKGAAAAQRIAAEAHPNLGSLSTLAIYEYYASDFAAGDKAAKEAADKTSSKSEAEEVKKQTAEFRKRGKAFAKQKKEIIKAEKTRGKETLKNPFGGLGGSTGTLGE